MTRPFARSSIIELRKRFEDSPDDAEVLAQLADELQHRSTASSAALLEEVRAVLKSPPIPPPLPLFPAEGAAAPRLGAPPQAAAPLERKAPEAPPPVISLIDAYRLLKASPSSTWEPIEQQRRQQVQAASPTRIKGYSAQERSGALAQARLVNAAYAVISQARTAKDASAAP